MCAWHWGHESCDGEQGLHYVFPESKTMPTRKTRVKIVHVTRFKEKRDFSYDLIVFLVAFQDCNPLLKK